MILPRAVANLLLALTFLCGIGGSAFAQPAAPSFTQIVVFGDNLSDTGNVRDRMNSKSASPRRTFRHAPTPVTKE
jgi:phospholipase/lecithinase/hemolysin